jgi:uncharacterized membrane protein
MEGTGLIVILRLIHILVGGFWVGGAIVTAFFLLPTVKATGPIGGQFAGALIQRTHLPEWLTVAGLITVLSGVWLYWIFYAGLPWNGFFRQVVYGMGALFAVAALIIGFAVAKPTAARMSELGEAIAKQGAPPTAEQSAERSHLLNKLTNVAMLNSVLILITLATMAIGRYV